MYLSCDTKKFHDNESTYILHNFWTSTHRGEASLPFPPGGATVYNYNCPSPYLDNCAQAEPEFKPIRKP